MIKIQTRILIIVVGGPHTAVNSIVIITSNSLSFLFRLPLSPFFSVKKYKRCAGTQVHLEHKGKNSCWKRSSIKHHLTCTFEQNLFTIYYLVIRDTKCFI